MNGQHELRDFPNRTPAGDSGLMNVLQKPLDAAPLAARGESSATAQRPPSQAWRASLKNHARDLIALHSFTVPTATSSG
jgi:hypothetical protein